MVATDALIGTFASVHDPGLLQNICFLYHVIGGGTGVASTVSIQHQATMTSGQLALVLYRVLASINVAAANVGQQIDALTSGFPRIFNGAVPFFLMLPTTTTAGGIQGTAIETQG